MTKHTEPDKKLKARDIVSGWPRGKSTGGLGTWSASDFADEYHWFAFWGHSSWSEEDFSKLIEDLRAELDEHVRQTRMLYAYFERYRRLTEFGDCLLDPGYFLLWGRRTKADWFRSKTL